MLEAPLLEEGHTAPKLKLTTEAGTSVDLASLKGHPTVVYFYPKDDTSGCTAQAKAFTEKHEEFLALNVRVIGISPDSVASHKKFKDKYDLSVTLGADEDKTVATAWGVWVEKSMYGKKYMGVERTTFLIGKDGKIAKIWRKVKVPGHADEVLTAAKALT
jgi:thioredoxin-dependent peroxiredoxin